MLIGDLIAVSGGIFLAVDFFIRSSAPVTHTAVATSWDDTWCVVNEAIFVRACNIHGDKKHADCCSRLGTKQREEREEENGRMG